MTHHDTSALGTVTLLDDLARVCRADERGFRAAADRVQREEFSGLLSELAERRERAADEFEAAVRDMGGEPSAPEATAEDGWLAGDDAPSRSDEDLLVICERNEEATGARFREALNEPDLPEEIRDLMEERAAEIEEARGRLRGLEFMAENGS